MDKTFQNNRIQPGPPSNASSDNGTASRIIAPPQQGSTNYQLNHHHAVPDVFNRAESGTSRNVSNLNVASFHAQRQSQLLQNQHGVQSNIQPRALSSGVNLPPGANGTTRQVVQRINEVQGSSVNGSGAIAPLYAIPGNPSSQLASWSVPNPLGSLPVTQKTQHQSSQIPTHHIADSSNTHSNFRVLNQYPSQRQNQPTSRQPGLSEAPVNSTRNNVTSQHHVQQQQNHQLRIQQQQELVNQHVLLQQQDLVQQNQHLPHPKYHSGVATVTTMVGDKPKVVLSNEAKQALRQAILSAMKSTTGEVDPLSMQAALQTGLPRQSILNAVNVARERDFTKRQQMKLQQQQQRQLQMQHQQQSQVLVQQHHMPQQEQPHQQQHVLKHQPQQLHQHQSFQHQQQNIQLEQQKKIQQQQQNLLMQQQQQQHQQQQHQQQQQQQHQHHQLQHISNKQVNLIHSNLVHSATGHVSNVQGSLQPVIISSQQQVQHHAQNLNIHQQRQPQKTNQPQHKAQKESQPKFQLEESAKSISQKKQHKQKQLLADQAKKQQKIQQQMLQQQKVEHHTANQKKLAQQQEEQKRKHDEMQLQFQTKLQERSHWKRAQSGVFLNKKNRYMAVQNSVSALSRCSDTQPVINPRKLMHKDRQDVQEIALMLQKQLRRRIASGASYTATDNIQSTTVERGTVQLLDPEKFRRTKIEPKKFAKALDRVARKSRQSVSEHLLKQYKEINKHIVSHQQDFFKFHRQRKSDVSKVARSIRDSFEKEEKKKEKEEAQYERARLAALKANDMTAYSKLLEETKNDRLKYLLETTEKQFTQISTLLQKRSDEDGQAPKTNGTTAPPSSYYASAHLFSEEVRQPSILTGGDLKEYQLSGLQWMVSLYNNKLNGILADEMGLGKTIQAISLIAYLMEFKQNLGPFLVIVPLSTLSNWEGEFSKWCPSARTVCYKGLPNQRKEIYKDQVKSGQFNVLLTTYEYIIRDKNVLRRITWQYAIVDEGHRMKNVQSKFAVTLSTQYSTKYRILLTGTPLMNDLSELWSLLNFLLPTIFNSVTTFDQWFSAPFASFTSSSDKDDTNQDLLSNEERVLIIHRLHELLRPFMLRRVKSEVLDQLPEKVEKVLKCDLSSWQKELYKQISKKVVDESNLLGETDTAPSRGFNNIIMQLRKVCNHPLLFSPDGYQVNEEIIRSSTKVALLDQMLPKLKAAGHRILMFTQMTQVMTILEDFFALRGYLSLRLDGSTPAEEREKRMYRFNCPDSPYFIFLLSTRAGGLGLNLTAADTVIIFDSDWNPMQDLQAQDRAHRIGQRSDVSVFRLCSNSPVEEKILSRANEKLNVAELVVESGKFNKDSIDSDNSLERKRLMEILLTDFNQTTQPKVATDVSGSDQDENEVDEPGSDSNDKEGLNELLSNNEADFQLYEAFDLEQANLGFSPAPLYTEDEDIPNWIRFPPIAPGAGAGIFASIDDGAARKRKLVMYDDGLTEKQFMRLMDKEEMKEEHERKKIQKVKGPRKVVASENTGADTNRELLPVTSFHGQSGTELTDWTYRKLISCGKSVVSLKDPSTKRRLSDIFLEKPDPATFPDYYEVIERPIAINDILRKCRAKLYNSIPEFKDDWKLMFSNARKFNGDGSWVVDDAKALERELDRLMKKNGFFDDLKPPTSKATFLLQGGPTGMKVTTTTEAAAEIVTTTTDSATTPTGTASGKVKIKISLKNLKQKQLEST